MRAKESVEKLESYSAPLEGRRDKLRLDFNESSLGPSPRVMEAIAALPPSAYAAYPEYGTLSAEYATQLGVAPQCVGLFNGADAAIRAVFDAFGSPGERFLTTAPTFGYYGPCAKLQGMEIQALPYADDLSYPLEAMQETLATGPRICFICNPNNPTGTLLGREEILSLARSAPETLVVVDELYADFTGISVLPEATKTPNVVALRSLSKTHGLAGLRLGFAIGPTEIVDRLCRVTGPYDVNTLAVVAARAALADTAHVERHIESVAQNKPYTEAELRRRGVRHHSAGGNFLLVWPEEPVAELAEALDQRGIRVRPMKRQPLIDGSFRLSIGTREQMQRFFSEWDQIRGR